MKYQLSLISLLLCFCCFALGFYLGNYRESELRKSHQAELLSREQKSDAMKKMQHLSFAIGMSLAFPEAAYKDRRTHLLLDAIESVAAVEPLLNQEEKRVMLSCTANSLDILGVASYDEYLQVKTLADRSKPNLEVTSASSPLVESWVHQALDGMSGRPNGLCKDWLNAVVNGDANKLANCYSKMVSPPEGETWETQLVLFKAELESLLGKGFDPTKHHIGWSKDGGFADIYFGDVRYRRFKLWTEGGRFKFSELEIAPRNP